MPPRRQHLNFVLFGRPDLWLDRKIPTDGDGRNILTRLTTMAREAEEARIDAVFNADFLGFDKEKISGDPSVKVEPLAAAAALAAVTERIGLVVTQSTTFFEPYNVARQIATLHNLSGGRAGWNAVTSFNGETNFGPTQFSGLSDRYERAAEFVEVVQALWETWDADALDFESGRAPSLDTTKVRKTDHVGRFYSVEQPLDVSRVVEEQPVIFQAGASEEGIAFAARFGEAVFVATPHLEAAHEYYDKLKDQVVANGRDRDSLRVLPGLRTYIGDTEAEAWQEYHEFFEQENYYDQRIAFVKKEADFFDLEGLELDEVIPPERIPTREQLEANPRRVSRALVFHRLATEAGGVTLREFLHRIHGFGHLDVVGTTEQVADTLETWFTERAADGFVLQGGNSWERFANGVLPLLRERGVARREYEGTTLRSHLGLA